MSQSDSTATGTHKGSGVRVALLYQRGETPDAELAKRLYAELSRHGHTVFIDRNLQVGVKWAGEIEQQIRRADAIIPLISSGAIDSEMLGFEIEHAHACARDQQGQPRILPVRVLYTGPLHEPMAGILDPVQYYLWEGEGSDAGLFAELLHALAHLPLAPASAQVPSKGERLTPKFVARAAAAALESTAEARPTAPTLPLALESIGGAVPLQSSFYVERPADQGMEPALAAKESIILVKGSRQMGKTSLLARGLHWARTHGARAAFTDLQKLNARNLKSPEAFFHTLGESLADQLGLQALPSDSWDARRSANVNFERYLRSEVLLNDNRQLIWGLDEVDRLFAVPFGSEVFGLFRSWHNERALDPTGPWSVVTLLISYATEAHLFISDMNQSPFNVGMRLELEDFTQAQVAELNRRYHSPVQGEDLNRLTRLLGGQPYLIRRALHELATQRPTFAQLEAEADREDGIFGDHLRRILVLLAQDPALMEIVAAMLRGEPCPTPESFFRLRSAGLLKGATANDAHLRCRLYTSFLKRHLA